MSILDRLFGQTDLKDEFEEFDDNIDMQDDFDLSEDEFGESTRSNYTKNKTTSLFSAGNKPKQQSKILDFQKPSSIDQEVVIIEPRNIKDAQRVCDDIKQGKIVVCNLERIDPVITQRVIDFITGGTYALSGGVTSVSAYIFIASPSSTEVSPANVSMSLEHQYSDTPISDYVRRTTM